MPETYSFTFGGEELLAAADRTLWWPAQRTLFATDLHAGKTAHMQRAGLALPAGNMEADLERLAAAIARTGATRLIFLGDLFHSEMNPAWETFAAWCQAQPCAVELMRGNHDRFLTDEQLQAAGIAVHRQPYACGPFSLRHHPLADPVPADAYVICGHVHPVRRVFGAGRDMLRLPCFWFQDQQLMLPAFGSFTGGYDIGRPKDGQTICCGADFRSLAISPAA